MGGWLGVIIVEVDAMSVDIALNLSDFHFIGSDFDCATGWDNSGINGASYWIVFASENRIVKSVDCVEIVHGKNLSKEKKENLLEAMFASMPLLYGTKSSLQ